MADTGERRQIMGRANAKEAEKVRESKKMISEEHSTEKAGNAAFGQNARGTRQRVKPAKSQEAASGTSKA